MDLDTLTIHGYTDIPLLEGAISPPLQLATTFERERDGSYPQGFSYARKNNPNRDALEATLTKLEGGSSAACFASGTAATMAVFQTLQAGDHVLVPRDSYYGTRVMLAEIFPRWGLTSDLVDMTDLAAVQKAVKSNTRVLWIETPSNPTLRVSDLQKLTDVARRAGALAVADNTLATPLLQRPFEFGVDLVVHSTTKYLNGHSDVIGGAVIARQDGAVMDRLRAVQIHGGAVPSPFDCWMTLRGLKTFAYRVRAQCENTQKIAEFLATHPAVSAVHYAGLESHPHHALAKKQMRGFGGLLSFEVRGGETAAFAVAGRVKLIRRATSLGGVETLIEQRASMEGPGTSTPANLLRLAVGLEAVQDLIADLKQALDQSR